MNKILDDILTAEPSEDTLRNILLITSDTSNLQVETMDQVEELCKSKTQRIFPIAIGDNIDKTLIYKLARSGKGYPSFVPRAELLLVNTIRQLDRALRPSFYDLDVDFNDSNIDVSKVNFKGNVTC